MIAQRLLCQRGAGCVICTQNQSLPTSAPSQGSRAQLQQYRASFNPFMVQSQRGHRRPAAAVQKRRCEKRETVPNLCVQRCLVLCGLSQEWMPPRACYFETSSAMQLSSSPPSSQVFPRLDGHLMTSLQSTGRRSHALVEQAMERLSVHMGRSWVAIAGKRLLNRCRGKEWDPCENTVSISHRSSFPSCC